MHPHARAVATVAALLVFAGIAVGLLPLVVSSRGLFDGGTCSSCGSRLEQTGTTGVTTFTAEAGYTTQRVCAACALGHSSPSSPGTASVISTSVPSRPSSAR